MVVTADCHGPRTVKVAVIGTGLAGLTSAYLLEKFGIDDQKSIQFEVHVFEKNASLGMDASSISVSSGQQEDIRIDVPMRSFMSGYYDRLFKLYKHLGVACRPARFSFGWSRIHGQQPADLGAEDVASYTQNSSYLTYSGARTVGLINAFQKGTQNPSSNSNSWWLALLNAWCTAWVFIVVASSYLKVISYSVWYQGRAQYSNPAHPVSKMTIGQWFQYAGVHPYFVHKVFIPLFAAVCTNSWESMLEYPAVDVLEYMAKGIFQESFVVTHGVCDVVDKLTKPVSNVHVGVQIQLIRPGNGNHLHILEDDRGQTYDCDHVIFATQANHARNILQASYDHEAQRTSSSAFLDDMALQIKMLTKFKYETSVVINHTDMRLLPDDQQAWQTLNLTMVDKCVEPDPTNDCRYIIRSPHATTMTTHIVNWTNAKLDRRRAPSTLYLQTTNPCLCPDPKKILSVSWFERATVTLDSRKAIEQDLFPRQQGTTLLGPCQGSHNIWFVGSYCWYGIPLLEGCVASAEHVVVSGIGVTESVDITPPWGTSTIK